MLTELALIKLLTSKKYNKYIKVQSPWNQGEPKPLTGYYRNPSDDNHIYFYSDDKIGMALSMHYNCLVVQDYLGRYRPIVMKFFKSSDLSEVEYEFNLNFDKLYTTGVYDMKYALLKIHPADLLPGDFYIDGEGGEGCFTILDKVTGTNSIVLKSQFDGDHLEVFTSTDGATFDDMIYTIIKL